MRHQKKRHRLGRTRAHREATLAALSNALIEHKRITTTLAKAKALRMFVEPILNRAKDDTTHNRREAFKHLQSKNSIKILFDEIADKIDDRPGGYTRVVKLGQRHGDAAEMAVIELVDYNETGLTQEGAGRRRRRTRRGSTGTGRSKSKGAESPQAPATATATAVVDQPTGGQGVDTATEELPVTEEQMTPIPERTNADPADAVTPDEAKADEESTPEATAEAEGEGGEEAADEKEDEEKK
jgi:large subunit ribosomal protein L17